MARVISSTALREFARALCEIVGEDTSAVQNISLDLPASGVAKVTITKFVSQEQADKINTIVYLLSPTLPADKE